MLNLDGEEIEGVVLSCIICGSKYEVMPYNANRRVMCGKAKCLREYIRRKMADYRKTERGKEATREMNKRYKVPDKLRVCKVCGVEFYLARVRNYCDKCKEELHG